MEVHLPESQEAQLVDLAAKTGRGTDELVQEAVPRMPAHADSMRRQVQVGLDQIARGEFLEEKQMKRRVDGMLGR